ncbi:MAG: WD40 repeat domain-containing protein, partial [Planctomycetota bacterium]
FSPDGKLVARRVRTEDHVASIELHETKTWALVATIPIEGPFAFAPTSDKLFVAAVHREWQGPRVASGVETYSTKGKLLARWEDQEQLGSTHVECSPDGRLVVLTPGLRVFEAAGRQILLEGLGVDQRPFAFTKDGAALFTRGEHPRAIHRFSLATGLPSVLVRSDELNGPVAASPDGKSVACLLDTRKITIVDGTSGVTLGVLDDAGVNGGVIDMAFSPDGKLVAAVYHDARLRVFDLATWKLRFSAGCEATNVAWPDGGKTVVGFSEEAFSFFGAAKGELRKRVQRVKVRPKPAKAEFGFTEEPAITGTALSPDGKLAAFRFEATLELVSTETGRSVARLDTKSLSHQAGSVAFSPDSRRVVTAGAGYGATCVWDVAARRKVLEVNACNVVGSCREFDGACWSADGQRLASLGCDGLYVWDVR